MVFLTCATSLKERRELLLFIRSSHRIDLADEALRLWSSSETEAGSAGEQPAKG